MELETFEHDHLSDMKSYATIDNTIKELTKSRNVFRDNLLESMEKYGVKSIDNEVMKISLVSASSTTTIDLSKVEKEEPETYDGLLADYPKTSNRKASLRITVKKEG